MPAPGNMSRREEKKKCKSFSCFAPTTTKKKKETERKRKGTLQSPSSPAVSATHNFRSDLGVEVHAVIILCLISKKKKRLVSPNDPPLPALQCVTTYMIGLCSPFGNTRASPGIGHSDRSLLPLYHHRIINISTQRISTTDDRWTYRMRCSN